MNIHRRFLAAILVAALILLVLLAIPERARSAETKQARIALVISNAEYNKPIPALLKPPEDARKVADALRSLGFSVTSQENLTEEHMRSEVQRFKDKLKATGTGAVGFLYYAGHGGADKTKRDNFLLPVDAASMNPADSSAKGVGLNWIKSQLGSIKDPSAIVIVVDACRTVGGVGNDPKDRGTSTIAKEPLAEIVHSEPAPGFLIAYSTSEGRAAADDGPYAATLAKRLMDPGLTIPQVFEKIKYEVSSISQQLPYEESKIAQPLCLTTCETDVGGAYQTNPDLYTEKRRSAEEAFARMAALQADKRCPKGYEKAVRLRNSAIDFEKKKNLNTAGQTYEAAEAEALGVEAYLSSADSIASTNAQSAAMQKDMAKNQYSTFRQILDMQLNTLDTLERNGQRMNWGEIRKIEKEIDSLVTQGLYQDALDQVVDGINLSKNMIAAALRQRPGPPTPKVPRTPLQFPTEVDYTGNQCI